MAITTRAILTETQAEGRSTKRDAHDGAPKCRNDIPKDSSERRRKSSSSSSSSPSSSPSSSLHSPSPSLPRPLLRQSRCSSIVVSTLSYYLVFVGLLNCLTEIVVAQAPTLDTTFLYNIPTGGGRESHCYDDRGNAQR